MIGLAHLGSILRDLPSHTVARLRWKFGSGIGYWEERARRLGTHAVFNRKHRPEEVEQVSADLKAVLMPLLKAQLDGSERVALDFGCGFGRFTADLAATIGGTAIGVDPVASLLEHAAPGGATEYRSMQGGRIPLDNSSADVVFVVQVLCNITDAADLAATARELARVLNARGLLFVVENTTPGKKQVRYVRTRTADEYIRLFPFVTMKQVGTYVDLGETFSILAGRRCSGA